MNIRDSLILSRQNLTKPFYIVEKGVDTAKKKLLKCKESGNNPYIPLLNLRNTPRDEKTGSPTQTLPSRQTAIRIPTGKPKRRPGVKKP